MKPLNNSEHVESFYAGIICALLVVIESYDGQAIGFEILKGCDVKTLRRIAKREGDEKVVKLIEDYRRRWPTAGAPSR